MVFPCIRRAIPLPALLGLACLASGPARAQTAAETVLFLLTGDTQAPLRDGRYALDAEGENTVFLGGRATGRNTTVKSYSYWRLEPVDACRYRLFRLRFTTGPDGAVLSEEYALQNMASSLAPAYSMGEFDFRKLVGARTSRFGSGFSTQFTFTEAFEAQAKLDPAAVSGGRMVAFEAREFPSPRPQPMLIAGGTGTPGFELRFAGAVKYLQEKFCPKASAF